MKEIETEQEFKATVASDKLVVIDCYTTWCASCKLMDQFIQKELCPKWSEVLFTSVDIDEVTLPEPFLSKVNKLPTLFVVRNGQILETIVGANKEKLVEAIEQFV